ncbi:hypothetical protein F8388_022464, partial [Cannabis sativa]
MAELVSSIALNVLNKLASLSYEELNMAWGMKDDLKKLQQIMSNLGDVLVDAESKQGKSRELKNWLAQLKHVFDDAIDVLDEFECEILRRQVVKEHGSFCRKVHRFFSSSNPLVYRFSIAHRIKEIRQQLDEIAKNMEKFDLIKTQLKMGQSLPMNGNREMNTHSFVNPADLQKNLTDTLKDKKFLLASIMGGKRPYELKGLPQKDSVSLFFKSLFQVDPRQDSFEIFQVIRVHDLIHNLACSITQNECSIVNSNDDREISDTVRYLRVVINENNLKKLSKLKKLKSIHVKCTGDEKDEVSLRFLGICGCENLKALPNDFINCTALRSLLIGDCDELNLASEFINKDVQLSLQTFVINALPETTELPQWLQQAANTLQKLHIEECPKLSRLPEWLPKLTSLEKLVIKDCQELLSLPDGMEGLTSLTHLQIKYCDALQEACKEEVGPDWHKIAHVPNRI